MDYKKLSTIIFMISGVATVVWGVLANDWSKCWLCAVIGGVIGSVLGISGGWIVGLILSVVGACILIWLYRKLFKK